MTMRPASRMTSWSWWDTVVSFVSSLAVISLWVYLLYGIIHEDMVAIASSGIILILDALYDIRNKEGGH